MAGATDALKDGANETVSDDGVVIDLSEFVAPDSGPADSPAGDKSASAIGDVARFVHQVPIQFAREHEVFGSVDDAGRLQLLHGPRTSVEVLDILGRHLNCPWRGVPASADEILQAINHAYEAQDGQANRVIGELNRQDVLSEIHQISQHEDLLTTSSRAPVIRLVNLLLVEAIKLRASDIHIQPYESRLVVRTRIDGVLFDLFDLPKAFQDEIASRIKIIGQMNIAERRLPQDGRATVNLGERVVDLRLSCVPTSHGERLVIRLLDKSARLYTLEELGMPPDTLGRFRKLIGIEHGLVMVTGPTGSGKSTTLYAGLQVVNLRERNIITIEDPIEYQLAGVSQIQVHTKKGMTFASALRSVLRQDPDIIMVGEIRDHETAVMAIQSALTGHLVFSTLHTNDAASAVTRLLDLGIEPYLVASSVVGVMAQRLVRRICPDCAEPYEPSISELTQLGVDMNGLDLSQVRKGRGCDKCRSTGFRGRVGLFELLAIDNDIRLHVQQRDTAAEIKQTAVQAGMRTLREDGVKKVLAGQTTCDEVMRVTMRATV